jgi:hypothetical protein
MNAPWHALSEVKALVATDRFDLGVTSATNRTWYLKLTITTTGGCGASFFRCTA